jgi:hypothetical protein
MEIRIRIDVKTMPIHHNTGYHSAFLAFLFLSSHYTWRGGGGRSPNSDEGTYTVFLSLYMYFEHHAVTTPHLLEDAELRKGPRHIQPDKLQGFLPGEGGGRPAAPSPAGGGGRRRKGGRHRLRLPGADQVLCSLHQDAVQLRRQVQLKEHEKEKSEKH